ncbi:MAG: hypothetical protein NTY17_13615 [Planctomycetia bacterium]|nr:hypothetical protein [Planctomycetia bacterium]
MPSITPMPFRVGVALLLPLTLHLSGAVMTAAADPTDDAALRDRLRHAVEWLAAPEREGRGPGTKGIDQTADWVAKQLTEIGLGTVASVAPGTDPAPPPARRPPGAPSSGSS